MDENAIHQWLIECFGPIQGEMAWNQLSQLPEAVRDQLMSQDPSKLPKPADVQSLMQAFTAGGLNSMGDMQRTVEQGPINAKLASSIALQQANDDSSQSTVNAQEGDAARRALSEANLWLDTVSDFDPAPGEPQLLTRADWVNGTLDAWAKFSAPVAESMNNALASVMSERLGGLGDGQISGMFAGPIPIPIPEGMKDPAQLMKLLGNTSFAMQLGHAAGGLSHEVRGSFDQGIALLKNPAGALIVQNAVEYATTLEIDRAEVLSFLALQEVAHARLFANVPWLMPRFEALIGKYARGISIDLDAMEEQLRDAGAMDPESIAGAVNLTKVGIPDTPEQCEALSSLETMLALVEGWVDTVTWNAGMAHIPHIEQLREMLRRERAVGGPAERTFESLLGMQLRPKRMREAAALWERIGTTQGSQKRDAQWSHPDLLPVLPPATSDQEVEGTGPASGSTIQAADTKPAGKKAIDWDAELSKLLDSDGQTGGDAAASDDAPANNDTGANGAAHADGAQEAKGDAVRHPAGGHDPRRAETGNAGTPADTTDSDDGNGTAHDGDSHRNDGGESDDGGESR